MVLKGKSPQEESRIEGDIPDIMQSPRDSQANSDTWGWLLKTKRVFKTGATAAHRIGGILRTGVVGSLTFENRHDTRLKMMIAADPRGFRAYEKDKLSRFGISKSRKNHPCYWEYVQSLLFVDYMDQTLKKAGIVLPKKIKALDAGAGARWQQAYALHGFLSNQGGQKHEVDLEGIDYLATETDVEKVRRRLKGLSLSSYRAGDVMSEEASPGYDVIFAIKPLTDESHHTQWNVPYTPAEKYLGHLRKQLKPDGHLIALSLMSAGEFGQIHNAIPKNKRVATLQFPVNTGNQGVNDFFTPGWDRVMAYGVVVAKK